MISFSGIHKQYGKQLIFVDASFQLNPGEKVGLVGPNGSGKTTLFRMVVGEDVPDEGDVSVPKKLTIGYFRPRHGPHSGVLRRGTGGVRTSRRLPARSAGSRGAARARLQGRPDRWRRRGTLRRLEDARGAGARAARPAGGGAVGIAHRPLTLPAEYAAQCQPQAFPGQVAWVSLAACFLRELACGASCG